MTNERFWSCATLVADLAALRPASRRGRRPSSGQEALSGLRLGWVHGGGQEVAERESGRGR
eukprot:scaffold34274_cov37-Tisochrysis_lutea.AAC.1